MEHLEKVVYQPLHIHNCDCDIPKIMFQCLTLQSS